MSRPVKDWEAICAKCRDGESPKDCQYYGDPDGCSADGHYPMTQIGNTQKMRETLVGVYNILEKIRSFTPRLNDVSLMREFSSKVCRAKNMIDATLYSPPRNCDKYSHDEALAKWSAEKETKDNGCFDEWLYKTASTRQKGK